MKNQSLALTLVTLAACSNPIPFEDLPSETALISCELLFDCCEEGQRQGYADEASCVTTRTAEAVPPQLAASVEAGRVAYDGAAAADCLAMGMCNLEGVDLDVCTRVYTGLVEAGGACTFGLDCVDGAQACIDGVCVAPAALGEACTSSCVEGAYCNPMSMTCETLPAVGEACPGFRCQDGAFCQTTTQMCEAARANGEACENALQCESFSCEAGVCAPRASGLCGEG